MMQNWFDVRKAAQMVAFFAKKEGGSISVLKLVKLIYLANRKSLERYALPILDDNAVSMDHGPVDSQAFDCINGDQQGSEDWGRFVSDRAGYMIGIANPDLSFDDLDEFSAADEAVLEETWREFGHMDRWQIRDYTHRACGEWENPNGSARGISYSRIFTVLGNIDSDAAAEEIITMRKLKENLPRPAKEVC